MWNMKTLKNSALWSTYSRVAGRRHVIPILLAGMLIAYGSGFAQGTFTLEEARTRIERLESRVALLEAASVNGRSAASSPHSTSASDEGSSVEAVPTPVTTTIAGTLALEPKENFNASSASNDVGSGCWGTNDFSGWEGAEVIVLDDRGETLGSGFLGSGEIQEMDSGRKACVFDFSIEVRPSSTYTFAVNGHPSPPITGEELSAVNWAPRLLIGAWPYDNLDYSSSFVLDRIRDSRSSATWEPGCMGSGFVRRQADGPTDAPDRIQSLVSVFTSDATAEHWLGATISRFASESDAESYSDDERALALNAQALAVDGTTALIGYREGNVVHFLAVEKSESGTIATTLAYGFRVMSQVHDHYWETPQDRLVSSTDLGENWVKADGELCSVFPPIE